MKTDTYTSRRLAAAHDRSLRVAQNSVENIYDNLDEKEAAEAYIALEDKVNEELGTEGTPVPPQQKQKNSVFRALDEGEDLEDALEDIPMNKEDQENPEKYVVSHLVKIHEKQQFYEVPLSDGLMNFKTTGVPEELPELEESSGMLSEINYSLDRGL